MYDPNAKPEPSRRQQIKQAHANRMNNQAVKKHGQEKVQSFYDAAQSPAPAMPNAQQVNQQAVQQHGQQAVQDFYGALQGNSNQPAPKYDPSGGASKKAEQPAVQPKAKATGGMMKVGPGFPTFDYMAQARESAPMENLLGMALAGGATPFSGGFYNPAPFGNQMMGNPMMGNQMMFGGYSPMGMGGFGGYNPMAQVPMGMGGMFGGFNRAGWGY